MVQAIVMLSQHFCIHPRHVRMQFCYCCWSSCITTGLPACRSLGQNFCTDDRILANIVAAARVSAGDAVIEIGPGTGNLTRHLLATQAQVLAVEKDDTLIERLRDELKQVRYTTA